MCHSLRRIDNGARVSVLNEGGEAAVVEAQPFIVWIQDGTIRTVRHGARWWITEAEVERYRRFLETQAAAELGECLRMPE